MTWAEQNQAALVREFAALRRRLGGVQADERIDEQAMGETESPAAIDELTRIFGLSPFERELLLLCAGVEMESPLAELCGELTGRPQKPFVTFSLAMSVLESPHWGALAPTAPLRRHRLIEMESGHGFTTLPLHIDERILHYVAGVNELDRRLEGMLHRREESHWLCEEHWKLTTEIVDAGDGKIPAVIHLFGDDPQAQEAIAGSLASQADRTLFILRMEDTPTVGAELEQFLTLWTRETMLLSAVLLLQWESEVPNAAAKRLAERIPGPLVIASRDPLRVHRVMEQFEVNKTGPVGQKQMWEVALEPVPVEMQATVNDVAEQFRLSAETIVRLGANAGARDLWSSCRAVSRPRLETLAERIVPMAGWDDLILPEFQKQTLRQLAAQSRHRMMVYEEWGFASKGRRGLGLSALFSGPSGTGKTLAAEVLAADLKLDMYRIDLSAVVSKYIGETEKNLKQVFDAAETGGVLLLFDEADALFGKRAEVKDSHDRYANIEVGYLLQRMESFQGLAVLTTNVKSSMDKAFQRRLRFFVDFAFPDATHRAAIWARAFPSQTPTQNLDPKLLSSLNMPGGNIKNIALNAAFLAADEGSPVNMAHVLKATHQEAAKAERPVVAAETRGWV